MKSKASMKNIKLPPAPEPTRAVYKKPVIGTYAPGMRVVELPCLYNPRPAPIPKPRPKPKKPTNYRKDDKLERAVKACKKKWWTEERVRMLIDLHGQGLSYKNIAEKMGTTKSAISAQANRLVERGLLEPRIVPDYWTQEELDTLMQLRAEGKTFGEIGDKLGRKSKTCGEMWRRQNAKQNNMRNLFS